MAEAIAVLVKEGAIIVDPVDLPSVTARTFQRWGTCSGVNGAKGKDADCSVVF